MTDFYSLLGIAQSATDDEVQKAIRQARRKWTTRASHPDAKIRAEAEQAMRDIAEAERVLLNAGSRAEYNRQLEESQRKGRVSDDDFPLNNVEEEPDAVNWTDQADTLMKRGAYAELIRFMEPIVRQQPQNFLAWYALGLAKGHNGEADDAISCLSKSVELNTQFDAAMGMIGNLFYDKRRFAEAEKWYTRAAQYDEKWRIDIADAQNRQEKYSEALASASMIWESQKNNPSVKEIYARCLRDHTYQSLSVDKLNGIYEITNEAQLNYMKGKISQFEALLPSDNQKVRQIVDHARGLISTAEETDVKAGTLVGLGVASVVLLLIAVPLGLIGGAYTGYKYWTMQQPHYKKSHSTVDRRTGLQS